MTFVTDVRPIDASDGSTYVSVLPGEGMGFQPANNKAEPIECIRSIGSGSPFGPIAPSNGVPKNGRSFPAICSCCAGNKLRAARHVSSQMIFDLWTPLILSSEENKPMENIVSNITPHITNQKARSFTLAGYLSDSNIIPIPNKTAEAISACKRNGFNVERTGSENNAWTIAFIVGMLINVTFCVLVWWLNHLKEGGGARSKI
jgi:hypothetical protein